MQTAATNDANTTGGERSRPRAFANARASTASTCGLVGACSTNHQNFYVKVVVTGTETSLLNYAPLPAGLRAVTIQTAATMRVTQ